MQTVRRLLRRRARLRLGHQRGNRSDGKRAEHVGFRFRRRVCSTHSRQEKELDGAPQRRLRFARLQKKTVPGLRIAADAMPNVAFLGLEPRSTRLVDTRRKTLQRLRQSPGKTLFARRDRKGTRENVLEQGVAPFASIRLSRGFGGLVLYSFCLPYNVCPQIPPFFV